jgi:hypothetical protein
VFATGDFRAILADDPVDVDRLAEAIGRPLGRALAQYIVDGNGKTGVAKRALGSEVGSRVAAETVSAALERVDVEAAVETLVWTTRRVPARRSRTRSTSPSRTETTRPTGTDPAQANSAVRYSGGTRSAV